MAKANKILPHFATSCKSMISSYEVHGCGALELPNTTITINPMLHWSNSRNTHLLPIQHHAMLNKKRVMLFIIGDILMYLFKHLTISGILS
jgi:hypothetical protein